MRWVLTIASLDVENFLQKLNLREFEQDSVENASFREKLHAMRVTPLNSHCFSAHADLLEFQCESIEGSKKGAEFWSQFQKSSHDLQILVHRAEILVMLKLRKSRKVSRCIRNKAEQLPTLLGCSLSFFTFAQNKQCCIPYETTEQIEWKIVCKHNTENMIC